jgi:hypothetical protein
LSFRRHGVVRTQWQTVEDPAEVVVLVFRELPAEPICPQTAHELGVEARVDAFLDHFER